MKTVPRPNLRVRFKSFELDLDTHELFRNGMKVRLYGQPADVLAILVEHAGELVTRESLQKALWPENTYVDFEHSLNSAVARLREALGDNPDAPKIVETIPRLGYRFIATTEGQISDAGSGSARQARAVVLQQGKVPDKSTAEKPRLLDAALKAAGFLKTHWKRATASAAAAMALVATGIWLIHRPLPAVHVTGQMQLTYGGLDTLPTCLSIFQQTPSDDATSESNTSTIPN